MSNFKYILPPLDNAANSEIPSDFQFLDTTKNMVFVESVTDCLNAEQNGAEAVIWNSDDYNQLKELTPKKREYGWMLVSINIPVFLQITDLEQLNKIADIKLHGFYSEDLSLLKETQKKMKSLLGE